MDILKEKIEYCKMLVQNIEKFESTHDTNLFRAYKEKNVLNFITEMLIYLDASKVTSEAFDETTHKLYEPIKGRSLYECSDCGKRVWYEFGNNYIKELEPCKRIDTYSFDISVPSGKLVFCDWPSEGRDELNKLESTFDKTGIDIDNKLGCYLTSKLFAEHNIGHFFVGNSSPSVRAKGNCIHVENGAYEDEDSDEATLFTDSSFEDKGHVCTDLWWVTIFDIEVFNKIVGRPVNPEECGDVVVDVEPGTYRFTYDANACHWNDGIQNYLKIEKI